MHTIRKHITQKLSLPACISLSAWVLAAVLFTGCGTSQETLQFQKEMDAFCTSVSELNESINQIDAEADNAVSLALAYLDQLDEAFQDLAEMDFPEEYDYLESLADEAASYMQEAVQSYHEAYADGGYDQDNADYARENSARAFKRVQVILSILRGEDPSSGQAQPDPGSGSSS